MLQNLPMFLCTLIVLKSPLDAASINQYMASPISTNSDYEPAVCSSVQFRCSSGLCIHGSLKCNGIVECPQGDDEQSCSASAHSSSTVQSTIITTNAKTNSSAALNSCEPAAFYHCKESKRCIPWSQLCDGKIQCLLADDESQENCQLVPGFNQQDQQESEPVPASESESAPIPEPEPESEPAPAPKPEPVPESELVPESEPAPVPGSESEPEQPQQPQEPSTKDEPKPANLPIINPLNNSTHESSSTINSSTTSTVDYYSYQGIQNGTEDESSGHESTAIRIVKGVQSSDRTANNFYQPKNDAGLVFVNFGPIINGDRNVNGNGNDVGNGNGNGNHDGNGNGNGSGSGSDDYKKQFPDDDFFKNYNNNNDKEQEAH